MTDLNQQQSYSNMQPKALPNATAVLVLGILSIITCCCYGILGVVLGIIALILAGKDMKMFKATPDNYTQASYKNLNAGRICAIIGLILSSLVVLWIIFVMSVIGFENLGDPEKMQEAIESMQQL